MAKIISENKSKSEPAVPAKPLIPTPTRPQINKPGNFGFKPNARFQSINRGRR